MKVQCGIVSSASEQVLLVTVGSKLTIVTIIGIAILVSIIVLIIPIIAWGFPKLGYLFWGSPKGL